MFDGNFVLCIMAGWRFWLTFISLQNFDLGIAFCIAANCVICLTVVVNTLVFQRQNARADRGEVVLEGDVRFRYTI